MNTTKLVTWAVIALMVLSTIVLFCLKACGIATFSWWCVPSPILAPCLLIIAGFSFILLLEFIAELYMPTAKYNASGSTLPTYKAPPPPTKNHKPETLPSDYKKKVSTVKTTIC